MDTVKSVKNTDNNELRRLYKGMKKALRFGNCKEKLS